MERRRLGTKGPEVSVFGMGTMTFGAEADEAASHDILDTFVAAGGTLIDTADVYSAGVSERIIGSWLRGRNDRDELVIATKARFSMGEGLSGAGASYIESAVDASLERLGVDVIDLYQMHAWDPEVPLAETLGALDRMVTSGKVRYIGVSNYTGWQLQQALDLTATHGMAPVVSLQPLYNLIGREIEWDLLPLCIEAGVGLLPWSPLAGGWLSGKYSPDARPTGATRLGDDPARGVEAYDLRNTSRTWDVIDAVTRVAARRGVTPSQVALNWLRSRPAVSSVLLGARTVAQLEDNVAAAEWELDADEERTLTEVSAPGIPIYPYGFLDAYAGMGVWERLGTYREPPAIGR